MPIVPIGFQSAPGQTLGVSARRLSDGWLYDHADGTFREIPAARMASLPEGTGPDAGAYELRLATDPAKWPDDYYQFTVHDTGGDARVVGMMVTWIPGGDGLAPPAAGGGGGVSGPVTVAPASITAIATTTAGLVTTAGGGTGPSAAAVAAAVFATEVEAGKTFLAATRATAAAAGGDVAINVETGVVTVQALGSAVTRIVSRADHVGRRTNTLSLG